MRVAENSSLSIYYFFSQVAGAAQKIDHRILERINYLVHRDNIRDVFTMKKVICMFVEKELQVLDDVVYDRYGIRNAMHRACYMKSIMSASITRSIDFWMLPVDLARSMPPELSLLVLSAEVRTTNLKSPSFTLCITFRSVCRFDSCHGLCTLSSFLFLRTVWRVLCFISFWISG